MLYFRYHNANVLVFKTNALHTYHLPLHSEHYFSAGMISKIEQNIKQRISSPKNKLFKTILLFFFIQQSIIKLPSHKSIQITIFIASIIFEKFEKNCLYHTVLYITQIQGTIYLFTRIVSALKFYWWCALWPWQGNPRGCTQSLQFIAIYLPQREAKKKCREKMKIEKPVDPSTTSNALNIFCKWK